MTTATQARTAKRSGVKNKTLRSFTPDVFAQAPAALEWKKRCRTEVHGEIRRKIWDSRCGQYRVVLSMIFYGRKTGLVTGKKTGLADQVRAERLTETGWGIISRHHGFAAAQRACEEFAAKFAPLETAS